MIIKVIFKYKETSKLLFQRIERKDLKAYTIKKEEERALCIKDLINIEYSYNSITIKDKNNKNYTLYLKDIESFEIIKLT